jgi:hypothetical protein
MANVGAYPVIDYIPFASNYSASVVFKCIDSLHLQIT